MKFLLTILRWKNSFHFEVKDNRLVYRCGRESIIVDRSKITKVEGTCAGLRISFVDGSRRTIKFLLITDRERYTLNRFFGIDAE